MKEKSPGCFTFLIWALAVFVGGTIWRGYATSILWKWFVAGEFHLQELNVTHAIGLTMVVQAIVPSPSVSIKEYESNSIQDNMIESIMKAVTIPAITLAIGWLIHRFY